MATSAPSSRSRRVTAFEYDKSSTSRGRLVAKRLYNSLSDYQADTTGANATRRFAYTYDAYGQQVAVDDSTFGTPTTYAYDADGRLVLIASPQGDLHYAYDDLGRKIATWTGAGGTLAEARTQATTLTEYAYDELGRLVATTAVRRFGQNVDLNTSQSGIQPERHQTVFATDGRIDFELLPTANGVVTKDYRYDGQGRLGSLHHFVDSPSAPNRTYDDGETRLDAFVYAYAKDGSRTSEVWTDRSGLETTQKWTYDGLNRLTKEVYDGRDGAGDALRYTDRFAFDLSSNRHRLRRRPPAGRVVEGDAGAICTGETWDSHGFPTLGYAGRSSWVKTVLPIVMHPRHDDASDARSGLIDTVRSGCGRTGG